MGLFYLLTLHCFIRGLEADASRIWPVATVAACGAGMMTKEVMVTAPLMCLLFDRMFVACSWREAWRLRWRLYAGLASTWLLLATLAVTTDLFGRVAAGDGMGISYFRYLGLEVRAVARYFQLGIWPAPLVFDYGIDAGAIEELPWGLSVVVVLVLIALAATALIRGVKWGFPAVWFLVVLAPTSSFVPVYGQPVAESRMYLPLVATAVWVVWLMVWVARVRLLTWTVPVVVLFGSLSVARNHDFRSAIRLWSDVVAKFPRSHRAHGWLGVAMLETPGKLAQATAQLEATLRMAPGDPVTYHFLGLAYAQDPQRQPEAIAAFEHLVRHQPENALARAHLGTLLLLAGTRPEEAVTHLEKAVSLRPDRVECQSALGVALLRFPARLKEAIDHLETASRLNPSDAQAHMNLGIALLQLPEGLARAVSESQVAVQLQPESFLAWFNLGIALGQAGRGADAEACFQRASSLNPGFEQARAKLAELRQARAGDRR